MAKEKTLNDEELEKVNGGNYVMKCEGNLAKYANYRVHVDIDNAIIGNYYLFIKSDICWLYGKLINRYGVYNTLGIKVEDGYGNFNGRVSFNKEASSNINVSDYGTIEIRGSQFDILTNK